MRARGQQPLRSGVPPAGHPQRRCMRPQPTGAAKTSSTLWSACSRSGCWPSSRRGIRRGSARPWPGWNGRRQYPITCLLAGFENLPAPRQSHRAELPSHGGLLPRQADPGPARWFGCTAGLHGAGFLTGHVPVRHRQPPRWCPRRPRGSHLAGMFIPSKESRPWGAFAKQFRYGTRILQLMGSGEDAVY